ncbi:MAG: nucleotide exchange factor GrpE [Anaerolineales bacterium]|nr:nucleotide exchange factor GrpE [Anaerolineales bacterium]
MTKENNKHKKNQHVEDEINSHIDEEEIIEVEGVEVEPSFEESIETEEQIEEETIPEDIEKLKSALHEAHLKSGEYLDGWQRARAEFINYKKRVERDRQQRQQEAVGSIVLKILPVVDDIERALKSRPQDGNGAEWAEGIDLIYKKLQSILEAEGVKPMNALGEVFDPNLHEAIAQVPSDDYESGRIIEVLQQGYYLGDRVLRPALVRVAA